MKDRLRVLIVGAVSAEHITPQDIGDDTNLVGQLELDSVDMLEIAMTIEDEYGIRMPDDQPAVYTSVNTLCAHIETLLP